MVFHKTKHTYLKPLFSFRYFIRTLLLQTHINEK